MYTYLHVYKYQYLYINVHICYQIGYFGYFVINKMMNVFFTDKCILLNNIVSKKHMHYFYHNVQYILRNLIDNNKFLTFELLQFLTMLMFCCIQNTVDKLLKKANVSLAVGTSSWREQFIEAVTVSAGSCPVIMLRLEFTLCL